MHDGWTRACVLALAYAGSDRGAADLVPAARVLRGSLPRARLVLLWPAALTVPAAVARAVDERIDIPSLRPRGKARAGAKARMSRAARTACERTVAALEAACPAGVVVFTERGQAPYLPAYLCCLAGIPRRAALTEELGGGVLTDPLRPPGAEMPAAERYLYLLDALGLGHRAETVCLSIAAHEGPAAGGGRATEGERPARATGGGR